MDFKTGKIAIFEHIHDDVSKKFPMELRSDIMSLVSFVLFKDNLITKIPKINHYNRLIMCPDANGDIAISFYFASEKEINDYDTLLIKSGWRKRNNNRVLMKDIIVKSNDLTEEKMYDIITSIINILNKISATKNTPNLEEIVSFINDIKNNSNLIVD